MSSRDAASSWDRRWIHDPIVILAAPRSGSSVLFAALSSHPALWSLYRESNDILEGPFDPVARPAESNRLTEHDLEPDVRRHLVKAFYDRAGNLERLPLVRRAPLRGRGRSSISRAIALASRPLKRPSIRLVEKSPRNSLRVPFMRALFPDARFIHLVRDPRPNIASLYRAWKVPDRYKTYPLPEGFRIGDYEGTRWSFMWQPGWRSLDGRDLIEICADQWRSCNEHTMRDLHDLPPERALRVSYERMIADPLDTLTRVASWAGISGEPFRRHSRRLPVVQATTPPDARKWESLRDRIETVLPNVADVAKALGYG
jgi:hypothetical protein